MSNQEEEQKNEGETLTPKLVDSEEEEDTTPDPKKEDTENKVKREYKSKEKRIQELQDQKDRNEKRLEKGKRYIGLVRSVISGDAVKLIPIQELKSMNLNNLNRKNPIPELTLYLHGVRAPQLEKWKKTEGEESEKDDKKEQEPFAWDSRDFLRKRLVGKTVIYRIESKAYPKLDDKKTPNLRATPRCYGEIFLFEGGKTVNIGHESIRNGWLFVTVNKNFEKLLEDKESANATSVQEYKLLKDLENEALENGLGIHTTNESKKQASLRHVHRHSYSNNNKTAWELFEKIKNIPLHGVVEQVRSGSTLRIIILDRMDEISVMLAGIRCPDYFYNDPKSTQKFSLEAKYFTEHYLLNRDVEVEIDKLDDSNNFYGNVKIVDNPDFDIALELLREGLAYFIEWSVCKGVDPNELRNAEEQAKSKLLKIWKNKNTKSQSELKKTNTQDISGKVIEIISAGAIKIVPNGKKREPLVIRFSSLRVPRVIPDDDIYVVPLEEPNRQDKLDRYNEDRANSVYAHEAKEFLRKKLIGQIVTCSYDYSYEKQTKYYTVYFKEANVAVELLENGYGRVTNHYDDEPRSKEYQKLIYAQNKAQRNNKGVHKPSKDKPQLHIKDLTSNSDFSRAQLYLSYFKRSGRVSGVVEQVIGASRFKVWISSENLLIILSLHGVYCDIPQRTSNNRSFFDIYPIENSKNKGLHYVREKLYQRDVEIAINDVDKRSKFRGRVYFQGEDISLDLLEQGYAMLNMDTAPHMDEYKSYTEAQNKAKYNKEGPKNMWEGFDPKKEEEDKIKWTKEREERKKEKEKMFNIIITEIIDGSSFYFQIIGPETQRLEELMSNIHNSNLDSLPSITPKRGDIVLAKYHDGKYYRARVTAVPKNETDNVYSVFFIDYGNQDELGKENIKDLDQSKFGTELLHPQAQTGRLAYVKAPKFDDDFGTQAADLLHDLVYEQQCVGKYWIDKQGYCIKLGVPSKKLFVNITMVTEGLARVTRSKTEDQVYKAIQEEEKNAKKANLGIWVYGTVPDSDEEKEEEIERKRAKTKEKKQKPPQEKKEETH